MAIIQPFAAIRPSVNEAKSIAALPYDVVNEEEAREIVKRCPHSFLKIDRPEVQFEKGVDPYDDKVYIRARDTLREMIDEGFFIEDTQPCFYLYQLTWKERSQTGLVACASIDDYLNGTIKKHEKTREVKEQDRIRHVDTCNAQTGPIFLAYGKNDQLKGIIKTIIEEQAPLYAFISEDQIGHKVWQIKDNNVIEKIQLVFKDIHQIYIADGHHRAASAVKVGLKRRKENKKRGMDASYNYFLSVLFSHDELEILPYNRVVKDLNGLSTEAFIEAIKEDFDVFDCGTKPYAPKEKYQFGMYLDKKWYRLQLKKERIPLEDPVMGLDVSLLQTYLLDKVLGIKDPRKDHRIDFVGGIRGLQELEKRTMEDMKVAFSMYPTSIEELFQVADANSLCPQNPLGLNLNYVVVYLFIESNDV